MSRDGKPKQAAAQGAPRTGDGPPAATRAGPADRTANRPRRLLRAVLVVVASLVGLYAMLLIPEAAPEPPTPAGGRPFVWNRDRLFAQLESRFRTVRGDGCAAYEAAIDAQMAELNDDIRWLEHAEVVPTDAHLRALERHFFDAAAMIAACPQRSQDLISSGVAIRDAIKDQSLRWDMTDSDHRARLYRILYGVRAATEEVMLQTADDELPALVSGRMEPSASPAVTIHGVPLHSGDILVSRGGAPTSALIARGNDFPGNFSHIALLHVDGATGRPSVIEAHIERGVVVATTDEYLADKKLRIMVLRLRHDLPQVVAEEQLAHLAAERALHDARSAHIPYDFAMDIRDHDARFCSEVASAAFESVGIDLWRGLSSISAPGTARWLAAFGVRYFETHGPSDLEYDPQLVVVAEFRDPATLFEDHIDNAVVDAMLEGAAQGDVLDYDHAMLPLARVAKAYSAVWNLGGGVGPVPEGMSATVALRAEWLRTAHGAIKEGLANRAIAFERERGYRPPFWRLLEMARAARDARNDSDSAAR